MVSITTMEYIWTRFLDSGEEKELERKDRERMTLHHMLCQQDSTDWLLSLFTGVLLSIESTLTSMDCLPPVVILVPAFN